MSSQLQVRPGLLKRLRDISGISSDEAQAKMLGIGRTTLHRLETGAQPSAAIIVAICETYDLGIGEAFVIAPVTGTSAAAA